MHYSRRVILGNLSLYDVFKIINSLVLVVSHLHHGALTYWLLVIFVWWHDVFLYLTIVGPRPSLIMKYLNLEKSYTFRDLLISKSIYSWLSLSQWTPCLFDFFWYFVIYSSALFNLRDINYRSGLLFFPCYCI